MAKQNLKTFVNGTKLFVREHGPEILTGIGIAGMFTTTVLAVKVTPKALKLIEAEKQEKEVETLPPIDVVKVTWKLYIPSVAIGLASAACLIGASSENARRNAALATAYKLSEAALTEYKEKVIETIGEKKEQLVSEKVAKARVENDPVQKHDVIITGKGTTLCYDALFGRYFESDIDQIKKVVNEINRRILTEDYISLNDFYDELGIDRIDIGDDLGWNLHSTLRSKLLDVTFDPHMATDGRPCIAMTYSVAPVRGYSRYM